MTDPTTTPELDDLLSDTLDLSDDDDILDEDDDDLDLPPDDEDEDDTFADFTGDLSLDGEDE